MDVNDIKEKLVLLGVTAVVFLPLRLLVGQYLTEHWLGNLGIATLISVTLAILVKKGKLGPFGTIFKNQLTKALWGKSAKIIILTLVLFTCYFGASILLIERGNTLYHIDKEILAHSVANNEFKALSLNGPNISDSGAFGLTQIQYMDYLFSVSFAMLNDLTNGLLVNLHLILFMEQIEILGLFWFYRRVFKPQLVAT
ncbi:MAG: hypothetical protein AB1299_06510 [Thermoproteota archaeon]|jgi:hypothetical protein|nr:hypothetical protein [Candidatus Nitrosotenuis sp.]